MPLRRNSAITTAAILDIVFGSLFLVCCGCGLAGVASAGLMQSASFGNAPGGSNFFKEIIEEQQREMPWNQAVQIAHAVGYLVLGVAWIILGIGLLQMKSWARQGTLVLCAIVVLWAVAFTVYELAVEVPGVERATQRVMEKHPDMFPKGASSSPGGTITSMIAPVLSGVVQIAMAVSLIIVLLLRSTRDTFAGTYVEGPALDEGWSGAPQIPPDRSSGGEDDRGSQGIRGADRS